MKKVLLAVLISFGLQTQAQVSFCDSVSYTIDNAGGGSQVFNVTLNTTSGLTNMIDSMDVLWSICNTSLCYTGTGATASFPDILQTDTIKACYDAYIYIDTMTYFCHTCDSLVYDGNLWVLFSTGNPTEIKDSSPYLISEFYPNPAKEHTTISYKSGENSNLRIIDILGNKVKDIHLSNIGTKHIYIGDLRKGIYFGNLIYNNKVISIKKLIVK
jgi:hypothetical protein